jgi:hypothetical protein
MPNSHESDKEDMAILYTVSWTRVDPVEGYAQVTVTQGGGHGPAITKNGYPVASDSPEAALLLAELRERHIDRED